LDALLVILVLIVLAAAAVLAVRHTSATRTVCGPLTPEDAALSRLLPLRRRLAQMPPSRYRRTGPQYLKRLKIVLTIYVRERYGVTVRDVIDEATARSMQASPGTRAASVTELRALFDAVQARPDDAARPQDIAAVYDSAINLLEQERRRAETNVGP
jgi:hypothetical protein